MNLTSYIAVVINAICVGGVYGLTSSAWSFQVGSLRFANFAYGASLMVSMYLTYYGLREWNLPWVVIILLVLAVNFLLGLFMRKTVLNTNDRGTQILCTTGFSLIMINLVTFICTAYPRNLSLVEKRLYLTPDISVGTIQLICFVLAAVILFSFQMYLQKTWTGRAIRAVVQNRSVATLMGINSNVILDVAFAISYMMIGISGIMMMLMFQAEPIAGEYMQTIAFIVCVSAGLGSLSGAFYTVIIVAIVSASINFFIGSKFHDPLLFAIFVIILIVRPYGIFNSKKNVARTL